MEDQQADTGDLTPDAAHPPVPQSKTTRRRHRLPRGQAARVDVAETSAESELLATTRATSEVAVDPAVTTEPEPADEPDVAPLAAGDPDVNESDGAETADDTAPDDPEDELSAAQTDLISHRPAGWVLKAASVFAAILFVAAGAFAGAAAQRYLLSRAEVQIKLEVARTAADAITTLFTYTPEDLERLPQRSSQYLSGDFAADYKRYIDSIVAPNKQAQVTNQTQVLGAAVDSLSAKDATAIVYTNSVSTTPVKKGLPSLQYRSYRLDLKRDDRRWFVTRMIPVTTLDLTPRL